MVGAELCNRHNSSAKWLKVRFNSYIHVIFLANQELRDKLQHQVQLPKNLAIASSHPLRHHELSSHCQGSIPRAPRCHPYPYPATRVCGRRSGQDQALLGSTTSGTHLLYPRIRRRELELDEYTPLVAHLEALDTDLAWLSVYLQIHQCVRQPFARPATLS